MKYKKRIKIMVVISITCTFLFSENGFSNPEKGEKKLLRNAVNLISLKYVRNPKTDVNKEHSDYAKVGLLEFSYIQEIVEKEGDYHGTEFDIDFVKNGELNGKPLYDAFLKIYEVSESNTGFLVALTVDGKVELTKLLGEKAKEKGIALDLNEISFTVHLPPVDVDRIYYERSNNGKFVQKDIVEITNSK